MKRHITLLIGLMTALFLAVLLGACSASPAAEPTDEPLNPAPTPTTESEPDTTVDPGGPLVIEYRHGGECMSATACEWTRTITQDGTVTLNNGGQLSTVGTLAADSLAELKGLIAQTDFAAIRAVKFTDTCPIAYDGQETIYTFSTDHGDERIAGCEYVIDPALPLFAWFDAHSAELAPTQPTTPNGDTPLVIEYRHGGLCITGNECQWTRTITQDGTVLIDDGTQVITVGTLAEDSLAELKGLIAQTDYAAIRSVKFTGDCPTAYDGQEVIFTFSTDHGDERIASCEFVIDATLPLFTWFEQHSAEITPVP